jgi:hypothetical protein
VASHGFKSALKLRGTRIIPGRSWCSFVTRHTLACSLIKLLTAPLMGYRELKCQCISKCLRFQNKDAWTEIPSHYCVSCANTQSDNIPIHAVDATEVHKFRTDRHRRLSVLGEQYRSKMRTVVRFSYCQRPR